MGWFKIPNTQIQIGKNPEFTSFTFVQFEFSRFLTYEFDLSDFDRLDFDLFGI